MAVDLKPLPGMSDPVMQGDKRPMDPLFYVPLAVMWHALADRIAATTMQSKAGAPVAADIPAGEFRVFKNTTTSTVVLAVNDSGTIKSVALT